MNENPYEVLGVAKTASQDDIKKAYRKLAKQLHPDLHPDDPSKQSQFQAISAAYDLLGDAEKRRRFDAGEIDASGQERPERQYYHQYAGQDSGRRYDGEGMGAGHYEDMSDLFSDLFGRRGAGGERGFGYDAHMRGQDLRYHLEVDFMDAARGAKRRFTMPDGRQIEMSVPAGLRDGQTLRLKGKGAPGRGEGPAGDALVTVSVRAHPVFSRSGNDVELDLPISFDEAVLGARIDVPTIDGSVSMSVPKGVSSGHRLRLKGKGVAPRRGPPGDQIVRLQIMLPDHISEDLAQLAKQWQTKSSFDPRADLRRKS